MEALADSTETGTLGIYHLKRFWQKILQNKNSDATELAREKALLDLLGLGMLPTFRFLHEQQPDFASFENWIASHHAGRVPEQLIAQCNALLTQSTTVENNETQQEWQEDVLSKEDLSFWDEHGYVIIRNAITPEACQASRDAVWAFLGMDENDPATWYKDKKALEGIMVTLYRHPALDSNRSSPRIRRAYEQLWKRNDLIVTTDKTGFNPPETESFRYKGIGLHWDVSLATPIPFGAQGILYLTDTKHHQGALTLVPGFHNKIEQWLSELPAGINPREQNFDMDATPVAANAGDFIIWHHALPHSSSANRADRPRIVQYMYWYAPGNETQEEWV